MITEPAHSPDAKHYIKGKYFSINYAMESLKFLQNRLKEAFNEGRIPDKDVYKAARVKALEEEVELGRELAIIVGQGRFVQEDIEDSLLRNVEKAYMDEMLRSLLLASKDGQKNVKKQKVMEQSKFGKIVAEYLGNAKQRLYYINLNCAIV